MTAPNIITVLLAEDHAIVRQGLRTLLEAKGQFSVIGQAETGRQAVALAASLRPDVIIMDIAMPVLNGIAATQQILAANHTAKVIMLSAHSDDEYVERVLSFGAPGFLEQQSSAETLSQAIREVAQGGTFISATILKRMAQSQNGPRDRDGLLKPNAARLTPREQEVLQLVAEGYANKQVAETLVISIKTVEKHRQHLMEKLKIHETAGLTRYAIAQGIIESGVKVTIL